VAAVEVHHHQSVQAVQAVVVTAAAAVTERRIAVAAVELVLGMVQPIMVMVVLVL
jgi:hypothetical protein